jgi:hypothetical protein
MYEIGKRIVLPSDLATILCILTHKSQTLTIQLTIGFILAAFFLKNKIMCFIKFPPFSAEVKEISELHFYFLSGPS